jgi:hypothetical protein
MTDLLDLVTVLEQRRRDAMATAVRDGSSAGRVSRGE